MKLWIRQACALKKLSNINPYQAEKNPKKFIYFANLSHNSLFLQSKMHNAHLSKNSIMKKNYFFIKIIFIYLFFNVNVFAIKSEYFDKGLLLFNKKEFEKSKIYFEQDIVFNPKSENSYLYLAKIYNNKENEVEEEINLNNVLLLNPQEEEAIYMLTTLKIKKSDYKESKKLLAQFTSVCKLLCSKKEEIESSLKTITPENVKKQN